MFEVPLALVPLDPTDSQQGSSQTLPLNYARSLDAGSLNVLSRLAEERHDLHDVRPASDLHAPAPSLASSTLPRRP